MKELNMFFILKRFVQSNFEVFKFEDMDELTELKESIKNQFFLEKIFYLLKFTDNNPDKINSVGICWIDDEGTMATNSTILGNFIGIKSNSVNKNFVAARINKIKFMNRSGYLLSTLIDQGKWLLRRAQDFEFKQDTTIEKLQQFRHNNLVTSLSSPLPQIRKLAIQNPVIFALSKFKSQYSCWIKSFEKLFLRHWNKILNSNTENPYISISHVAYYISKGDDIAFHSKLVTLLKFFAGNSSVIDVNEYCIFCSFFGIHDPKNSNDAIYDFPLKIGEETNWSNWLELNKSSPALEKYLFDQPSMTWTLCFSDEPGKFVLLRKIDNYITQTMIYFDCLNRTFYTTDSNRRMQFYGSLNGIIKDRLQLSLLNLMNIESTSTLFATTIDIFRSKIESIFDVIPFFDDF